MWISIRASLAWSAEFTLVFSQRWFSSLLSPYHLVCARCCGSHETFIVVHKTGNEHDRHPMAFNRDEELGIIVGYLPREIAKTHSMMQYVCWLEVP